MSDTEYTEVKNTRLWSPYGDIETVITGVLADKTQARVGQQGEVIIRESYWNSGFCETCSYDEHDWFVFVNGEVVWNTEGWNADNPEALTQFGAFQTWLEGGE